MFAYEQQLARVRRFLNRIEAPLHDQTEYEDMVWAFLQNCWHLKDWILNDDSVPATLHDKVMDAVKGSKYLQVCADLANRSKHLTLNKQKQEPWRDAKLHGDATIEIGPPKPKVRFRYYAVDDRGENYELLDLARNAVARWEKLVGDQTAATA